MEDHLRWVSSGWVGSTLPNTFQVSSGRASPINTSSPPPLWSKGCLLEGQGKPPCGLKASARWCLASPLSIRSTLVYTERLRQRVGRYQRTGLTPPQSERPKFCFVLINVNSSFVSHRSFTAPMRHLHSYEGFSAEAIFVTLTFKWRSITVKKQWLCPPQGRATYTAEPVLRLQGWSAVTWELTLSRGNSVSVGMRDWNFSSCSGLARFFSR